MSFDRGIVVKKVSTSPNSRCSNIEWQSIASGNSEDLLAARTKRANRMLRRMSIVVANVECGNLPLAGLQSGD